jgi:hypothetical protein
LSRAPLAALVLVAGCYYGDSFATYDTSALFTDSFEGDDLLRVPAGWRVVDGVWQVTAGSPGDATRVLEQTLPGGNGAARKPYMIVLDRAGLVDYQVTVDVDYQPNTPCDLVIGIDAQPDDPHKQYSLALEPDTGGWAERIEMTGAGVDGFVQLASEMLAPGRYTITFGITGGVLSHSLLPSFTPTDTTFTSGTVALAGCAPSSFDNVVVRTTKP